MCNLAVAALSLLAVPTVASSNELSPPTGPAASSTGTYTIQYQYTAETYVCTPTYLQERSSSEPAWSIASDYNSDGAVTFTGKAPGLYEYRTYIECETPYSDWEIASTSITVQVGGTPDVDSMDVQETYEYTVRYGDINGDARTDFFLHRTSGGEPGNGVIDQVFLMQGYNGAFASSRRSSNDRNLASVWPAAQGDIFLIDINLDGFVDLMVRGLENHVSGTTPHIVFSSGEVFQEGAASVRPVDESLSKLVDELKSYYLNRNYYQENAVWVEYWYQETEWECDYYYWGDQLEVECIPYTEWVDASYWSYAAFESEGVEIAEAIDDIGNGGTNQAVIDLFEQILGVLIGDETGIECIINPNDPNSSDDDCLADVVSTVFIRIINALEEEDGYYGRPPGTIRVTGRHINFTKNWDNPRFHTALEYRDPLTGAVYWYSGQPNREPWDPGPYLLIGHVNDPRDHPRNMMALGTVIVPFSEEFARAQLATASINYCNCLEYIYSPMSIPGPDVGMWPDDKYNSNSYANGLIQYIDALFVPIPGVPDPAGVFPFIAPGWHKFVPAQYFE